MNSILAKIAPCVVIFLTTLSSIISIESQAQTAAHSATPTPAKAAAPSKKSTDRVLGDNWYTITVNKDVPAAYYNEKIEAKGGKIYFLYSAWKQEEGYINEEQLGAFAEDTADLAPLFYNFHSNYRSSETVIDGTVTNGKQLSVRVKKPGQDPTMIKRDIEPGTIFSQFFVLWLGRQLAAGKIDATKPLNFQAVMEDNLEVDFSPVNGSVHLDKADDFAQKTHTQKVAVIYRGTPMTWYVDKNGGAARIEIPSADTVIDRTTKEKAKAFFDLKPSKKVKDPNLMEGE